VEPYLYFTYMPPWREQGYLHVYSYLALYLVDTGGGGRLLTPEVKEMGHELNLSPLFNSCIKNVWSYTSIQSHGMMLN
jgi:hypothetical protein